MPEHTTQSTDLYQILQILVKVSIAVVLIFTFLGRLTTVSGSSMRNTLHDRDLMLVQTAGYTPRQGDVVVFRKDFRADINGALVKRVIAVGGQTVDIDYNTGTVSVDGVALDEPYLPEPMEPLDGAYLTNDHVTVPPGSVYVMGDNRNNSDDSRDTRLGTVDTRYLLGGARLILFPFGHAGAVR